MEFCALAYKPKEGHFYDFKTGDLANHLEANCLLPTEEMANQYIEENQLTDYVAVPIRLHSYTTEGNKLGYEMPRLKEWY